MREDANNETSAIKRLTPEQIEERRKEAFEQPALTPKEAMEIIERLRREGRMPTFKALRKAVKKS